MKIFRRLYDWVLHWAETPYGAPALFLLAFVESSFFPLPPDILLIALCLAVPDRSFRYGTLASSGSVLGGIGGYALGFGLWSAVSGLFFQYVPGFTPEGFNRVQDLFARYDFWVVFAAGFTPIPYKIITIGAGVFNINFAMFVLASALSRSLRFFILSGLVYTYGIQIRTFIDRYFNALTIGFMFLLLAGFWVVSRVS
jgi:membrane protein YqaA with SNARE-associated domain